MSCTWSLLRFQARRGVGGINSLRRQLEARIRAQSASMEWNKAAPCYCVDTRFKSNTQNVNVSVNKEASVSEMKQQTQRLLTLERMAPKDVARAQRLFFWWVQQEENVEMAWRLMDRLVEEQELKATGSEWLFRLVNAWRRQSLLSKECAYLTPQQVLDKFEDYKSCGVLPDAQIYSMLVDTCSKTASDPTEAAHFSQHILDCMKRDCKTNPSCTPDSVVYTNVIDAWARCGAPQKAEALLEELMRLRRQTDEPQCVVAMTSVLNAWTNSESPEAAKYADAILKKLEAFGIPDDAQCYSAVIAAYAKAGNVQKAEDTLKHMQARHVAFPNANVNPTTAHYNSLLLAYSNEGNAAKAEAMLRNMQRHQDTRPDTVSFNIVISALANDKNRDPAVAEKAESLLQEMWQLHTEGDETVKPDIVSLGSVIHLLSQSNDIYAPQRAERLLRRMHKDFQDGISDVKPNTVAYSSAINAWAQSRAPKAAQRAESLLRLMQEMHQAGDEHVKPNTVVYSAVIAAWSKSRSPKAAEKAEALLCEMQESFKNGNANVKPNAVTFTSVINAFANSRDDEAAEKAEAILLEMQCLYGEGDSDVKPNTISYNSVISAYAKSPDRAAGRHALRLLERMKQLQAQGHEDCKPTIITYNTVINALSGSESDDKVEMGYDLLAEAHSAAEAGDWGLQPNAITYSSLMRTIALSTLLDKAERASHLLNQMTKRSIEPTIFVLDEVLHCCSFLPKNTDRQRTAFRVARETLEVVHSLRNVKARPTTYVYYFRACKNASYEEERARAREFGYQRCRKDGLESNAQVRRAFSEAMG